MGVGQAGYGRAPFSAAGWGRPSVGLSPKRVDPLRSGRDRPRPHHSASLFDARHARPLAGRAADRQHVLRGMDDGQRSEEHTSELQSLMRNSYAVFCLKKKINTIILIEKKYKSL